MDARQQAETDAEVRRIRERFLQLQKEDEYRRLLGECEAAAVTWRAATDQMESAEPFYRQRFRGGRWAREGESLSHPSEHGYDVEGRIVIIREYYPVLFQYREELVEEVRGHYNQPQAIYVKQFYSRGDRLAYGYWLTDEMLARIRYVWEGDRLARSEERIHRSGWLRTESPLHAPVEWSDYVTRTYDYGPDGELDRITLTGLSDVPEIEYQRPRKRETVAALSREIEDRLVELVPAALAASGQQDSLYCVFLCYCSSGWNLVPNLCLASVTDRAEFDYGDGTYDTETMWYTGELSGARWVDLDDPLLAERWSLFYQLMGEKRDFSACPAMLRRVAKRLNDMDWQGVIPVTGEFVVTASDTEDGVDFAADFRGSVPAPRRALLKKRGLWE
jgi:alkylated DNA repair dioxygenase AlkB